MDLLPLASNCASKPVVNPSELLPHDANNEWAKLNPRASGDFQNVNLLRSGYWNGIDTVGSSLRNANLQVRSEPLTPRILYLFGILLLSLLILCVFLSRSDKVVNK